VSDLFEVLAERIGRHGPLPFDAFMDAALYHPQLGFYATGGGAGRRADFLTSPEVGPLFGAVIARALDTWWAELSRPDAYVVVDAGAGRGVLARAVLDAQPECLPALRYVCVERSAGLHALQSDLLPIEPAANLLGPVADAEEGEGPWPLAGSGPIITSLDDLPAAAVDGVVLANELLDNVPFRLLERLDSGWAEVRVGRRDDGSFTEVLVEAPADLADDADRLAPAAGVGARIPHQPEASSWLRQALGLVARGRVVVIDYCSTTPDLAARSWQEWLRTYRSHGRGGPPLEEPGGQDITCEVAVDQLSRVRPPDAIGTQVEFLAAHGIEALVDTARAAWQERAHIGDLEAMKARSRIGEADALLDPAGLGAFAVLEWVNPSRR